MHEGDGTECRLSDGSAGDRQTRGRVQRDPPDTGELHEEIVGVLMIDEWRAVNRLANLEDFPVTVLAERGRIEAQHAGECQQTARGVPGRHAHPPVGRNELLSPARAPLSVELGEEDAILHELPAGANQMLGVVLLGVRRFLCVRRSRQRKEDNYCCRRAGQMTCATPGREGTGHRCPRLSLERQFVREVDKGRGVVCLLRKRPRHGEPQDELVV